jgi:hypothetical protein
MKRLIGAVFATILVCGLSGSVRAADTQDAKMIVDKAIKALGGEETLSKIKAASWKSKGTITFGGNTSENTGQATMQDLDHFRQESEGEFNGNKIKIVSIVAGDKATMKFNDMSRDLDGDALAGQKRTVYLTVIPITLLPLKGKDFKLETIDEDKVGDKPAVGLKVTAPDKKDFKLYFDKETGLPVKLVAKVAGFQNQEFTQETIFSDYKEMAGIKKATKIVSKRDGEKFMEQEITEFKILDKVDPKTFTETL